MTKWKAHYIIIYQMKQMYFQNMQYFQTAFLFFII